MKHPIIGLLAITSALTFPLAAYAVEAGDWVLRARALGVVPQEDAAITGGVTGRSIRIDNSIVPELDISYFVTKNVALELIAATTPHDVHALTPAPATST